MTDSLPEDVIGTNIFDKLPQYSKTTLEKGLNKLDE